MMDEERCPYCHGTRFDYDAGNMVPDDDGYIEYFHCWCSCGKDFYLYRTFTKTRVQYYDEDDEKLLKEETS